MMPAPPERIGRYVVLAELGRGAMGVVHQARDPQLDRVVAIKTVRHDLGLTPEEYTGLRKRVYQEATAAGRLTHPSIVAIHDVIELDEIPYIVMEYVEGQTLADMIAAAGPVPSRQAVRLVIEVCGAVEYAHAHGVIHRDIKPSNILVTADGAAKVTDFGIARVSGSHVTRTGALLGTPAYMAPEQLRGRAIDGRSDIFALGVTLYEALTGVPPFRGEDLPAVLYQIAHEAPAPLSERNPAVPRALEPVIGRAMAKDPDGRYATARAFGVALAQTMAADADPGRAPHRVTPEPRRRRRRVRIALAAVACLTAVVVGSWAGRARWSPEHPVVVPRPSARAEQPPGPAAATPVNSPRALGRSPVPKEAPPAPSAATPSIGSGRSAAATVASRPPAGVPSVASQAPTPGPERTPSAVSTVTTEAASAPAPPLPAERSPVLPAPGLGSIRVVTDPSVDVFLDGEYRGQTGSRPLVVPRVSPGERMVTLRLGPRQETIPATVNGGQTTAVTHHFPPEPAPISVDTVREALERKPREALDRLREGVGKAQHDALGALRDVLDRIEGDRERRGGDRERKSERR